MPENTQAYPFTTGTPNAAWIPGGQAAGTTSANTKGQFGTAQVGDADYWLPIWSGEILNAYDQYNIFEPLVSTKAITSGTTMRFPITGTVGMKAQWKAGEELVGTTGATSPQWFDISLDSRPMASHFELDDISLMLSQWEYRSEMARQSGLALANARDKQIASLIAQAAFMPNRDPAVAKGGNFGGATGTSNLTTGFELPAHADFNLLGEAIGSGANRAKAALKFLEYLEIYMVRLQEMDAPTEGVYASVTPQAFQDIRALGIARSTAVTGAENMQPMFGGVAQAGGLGAPYTQGMNALTDTLEYMGVTIVKTNHMPKQTVELDGTTYAISAAADAAAGFIDSELLDIGPSTATTVGLKADGTGTAFGVAAAGSADELSAIKLGDIGDAKYNFDWSQFKAVGGGTSTAAYDAMFPVKALIWQKDAVAALNFQGLKVDTVQDVRRNTTFTVASKMSGGGVLRPELCAAVCGASVV